MGWLRNYGYLKWKRSIVLERHCVGNMTDLADVERLHPY